MNEHQSDVTLDAEKPSVTRQAPRLAAALGVVTAALLIGVGYFALRPQGTTPPTTIVPTPGPVVTQPQTPSPTTPDKEPEAKSVSATETRVANPFVPKSDAELPPPATISSPESARTTVIPSASPKVLTVKPEPTPVQVSQPAPHPEVIQVVPEQPVTPVNIVRTPPVQVTATPAPVPVTPIIIPTEQAPQSTPVTRVIIPKPPETPVVVTPTPAPRVTVIPTKGPVTTTPVTPTPAPINTPVVKANPVRDWVSANGVTYGGRAATDEQISVTLNTPNGPVFLNVGETIPGTHIEVVKADEKKLTLREGDQSTTLDLP